jgi:hypothetical protein
MPQTPRPPPEKRNVGQGVYLCVKARLTMLETHTVSSTAYLLPMKLIKAHFVTSRGGKKKFEHKINNLPYTVRHHSCKTVPIFSMFTHNTTLDSLSKRTCCDLQRTARTHQTKNAASFPRRKPSQNCYTIFSTLFKARFIPKNCGRGEKKCYANKRLRKKTTQMYSTYLSVVYLESAAARVDVRSIQRFLGPLRGIYAVKREGVVKEYTTLQTMYPATISDLTILVEYTFLRAAGYI